MTEQTETKTLEQQLLQAQQEVIRLQRELLATKPSAPEDDAHWHLISNGELAEDVIVGKDLAKLRELRDWIFSFGKKYIKSYVHPEVYAEVIAHMMRGIPERLAELETLAEIESKTDTDRSQKASSKSKQVDNSSNTPSQKVLPLPSNDKD